MPNVPKDHYGHMICLFLAEGIRTRQISLKRSAEIAEHVLKHVNLLETEHDFLAMVKELAKDFEELVVLEGKIIKEQQMALKRQMELIVKDYVVKLLPTNPKQALSMLQDASSGKFTLELLTHKYPDFKPEGLKR